MVSQGTPMRQRPIDHVEQGPSPAAWPSVRPGRAGWPSARCRPSRRPRGPAPGPRSRSAGTGASAGGTSTGRTSAGGDAPWTHDRGMPATTDPPAHRWRADEQPLFLRVLVVVGTDRLAGRQLVDARPKLLGGQHRAEPEEPAAIALRVLRVVLELGCCDVDPLHDATVPAPARGVASSRLALRAPTARRATLKGSAGERREHPDRRRAQQRFDDAAARREQRDRGGRQ